MKSNISILRTSCIVLASCVILLLSSCVRNELEKAGIRSSNEVKIAASVSGSQAPIGAKSAEVQETFENVQNEILEFRSEDGSVVLPLMLSVTEETNYASTKGTYINGPNDEGIFPTENLPLSEAMNSFTMEAYYTDSQKQFVPKGTVTWNGSKWAFNNDAIYYWPQSTGIDFYASANVPQLDGISITFYKDKRKQTLAYQVPDNTKNQKDILMAVYSGTGNTNGEAEILFKHPLTSVRFSRDKSQPELENVKQITMGGVYFRGTVDQSINGVGSD